jgi:hypothetical protein
VDAARRCGVLETAQTSDNEGDALAEQSILWRFR